MRFSCGCCSCGGQGLFPLLQLRKGPRCKRHCRPSKWNRDLTGRGYNSIKAAASLPTFHKKQPPTEGSVSTTPCGGKAAPTAAHGELRQLALQCSCMHTALSAQWQQFVAVKCAVICWAQATTINYATLLPPRRHGNRLLCCDHPYSLHC